MGDFDNIFDAAISQADGAIRKVMAAEIHVTSGLLAGGSIAGVFDDPENIGYVAGGVRIEGASPSIFVETSSIRQLRRMDTLKIADDVFWVDRITPDDCGSCYVWLIRGVPPASTRRR
ncbi:phage tail protein [Pluralibacter gergoviae]|uniref:head-tail joining protein n=1 Tax=Pluralibacter gergoviae TaxID=61647 RepID=UPI000907FD80|nr:head-tail joining protein [Pluralibacter gergoviae]OUR04227.1 phage tail protein [Pluralibacter gergoviae]